MTTVNYNYKINEDFLDDVHVEDEVDDDVEVSADEQSYEYLLRIDFKNKNAADKLGVLLKELAAHQPEIS